MARWIIVTEADSNARTLINLDNVDAVQGRTIFFSGGDDENYLLVSESFDDLIKLIANAEEFGL